MVRQALKQAETGLREGLCKPLINKTLQQSSAGGAICSYRTLDVNAFLIYIRLSCPVILEKTSVTGADFARRLLEGFLCRP